MRNEMSFTAPTMEIEDQVRLGFPPSRALPSARFVCAIVLPTYHAIHVDAVQ